MHFIELVRDWLAVEFPDLEIHVLSEDKQVGEILKVHASMRLSFVVAYISEDMLIFGPDWANATKIPAGDPECFNKAKSEIQRIPYNEPYEPGKRNYQTLM